MCTVKGTSLQWQSLLCACQVQSILPFSGNHHYHYWTQRNMLQFLLISAGGSICVHINDPEKRQCRKWQATSNGTPHRNKVKHGCWYSLCICSCRNSCSPLPALKFCVVVNHDIYRFYYVLLFYCAIHNLVPVISKTDTIAMKPLHRCINHH